MMATRAKTSGIACLLIGAASMLATVGCGSRQVVIVEPAWPETGETYTHRPPHAVLSYPIPGRLLAEGRGETAGAEAEGRGEGRQVYSQPGWVSRNDERLAVRPGASAMSITEYIVETHDTQRSFGDDIHNFHQRRVRSLERGRLIR